jgi:RHS repeat-associated protein
MVFMFKKYFLICLLFGYMGGLSAQNIPGGPARPLAMPVLTPRAYDYNTVNYIRTWEPSMPVSDPAAVISASNIRDVKQTTQYMDGLGRLIQTVKKNLSPSGKDIVEPLVYDEFDREQYRYLPFTSTTSDGKFKMNPFQQDSAFSLTQYPGETVNYSETEFDPSPLEKVVKTFLPGNSWAKGGGNKPSGQQYLVNTAVDGVRIWDVAVRGVLPVSIRGTYAEGELYKNVYKDENSIRTVEFKDKEGRLVLKKTELSTGAADGHIGWLCTYYVYDNIGNLRCVIPPKAVEAIRSNWSLSAAVAGELCYLYRYDGRDRMIVKKMPGADSTEFVYDVRDRVVFKRDGNLKKNSQWLVSFYDGLNRVIFAALYNSASSKETLQASMNTALTTSQTITHFLPAEANLTFSIHDGRAKYIARNSITFEAGFDSGTGATDAEINNTANQDTLSIVATNPLPNIPASALTPLIYSFYDDYSFSGASPAETADFSKPKPGSNFYAESVAVGNMTSGRPTGTKVRVLGTEQWLTSTIYYNDKGRTTQIIADNISGGTDITTNQYNFSGQLLSSYLKQTNLLSNITPQTTVLTMFHYDAAGRLDSLKKQLNDNTSLLRTISFNDYNELGQLEGKRLNVTGASTQLETIGYEYHIRNWLKSINKGFVNTPGSQASWFGEDISYDNGFVNNQLNGNIAGVKWKSGGDKQGRAYGYIYDNASRLLGADFRQNNTSTGTVWEMNQKDFSVSGIAYDPNGNISSMTQKGMIGTSIATIDQLSYTYRQNSNKLTTVGDPSVTTGAGLGDFINGPNTGADYDYDTSGNLIKDLNKSITAITYNHLNLPEKITIQGKGTIAYWYDANGNKLRKIVTDNSTSSARTTTTDYLGGSIVYRNDSLELVSHEEGRIRPIYQTGQPVKYYYDFFLKDHLDNVRVVLTEQTDLSVYTATMEASNAVTENTLFSNVEETRAIKPAGYPQDQSVSDNNYVAKLNARDSGRKIGPSLVLRVMAGDTVQIGVRAFYKSTGPKDNSSVSAEDMIANLLQAFGGEAASAASHAGRQAGYRSPLGNFNGNDYRRLKEKDPEQNQQDKPKAYLNFVFFDDQFNLVDDNSGVRQVKGEPDQLQTLAVDKMPVKKSGFLYVYTSNETTQDVLFDNLTIAANNGPLLEESHYYPFGLVMGGISYNALKGAAYQENRYKYNGIELTRELDLNAYEAFYRNLDPQLGRWWQIDPKAEEYYEVTPYNSNLNNPVRYKDPKGDCPSCLIGGIIGFAVDAAIQVSSSVIKSKLEGKPVTLQSVWDDFDGKQSLAATAAGAVTGGISSLEQATVSTAVKVAGVNASLSVWRQVAKDGKVDPMETMVDALSVPEGKAKALVNTSTAEKVAKRAENALNATTGKIPARKVNEARKAAAKLTFKTEVNKTYNQAVEELKTGAVTTVIGEAQKSAGNRGAKPPNVKPRNNNQLPSDNTKVVIINKLN